MTRPTIQRAACLAVIVILAAGYLLWRSIAISQATDRLRNQMKTGAIDLIDDRFNGPEAQRTFIRESVERVHAQTFEACEMESSFWPIGTRGRKGSAEVSVNLQQYLKALHAAILSDAGQKGIEIDGPGLERAMLVAP